MITTGYLFFLTDRKLLLFPSSFWPEWCFLISNAVHDVSWLWENYSKLSLIYTFEATLNLFHIPLQTISQSNEILHVRTASMSIDIALRRLFSQLLSSLPIHVYKINQHSLTEYSLNASFYNEIDSGKVQFLFCSVKYIPNSEVTLRVAWAVR